MRQLESVDQASADGVKTFTLALAGLATGEYTIEVVAKGAGGNASDRLTFRVTF